MDEAYVPGSAPSSDSGDDDADATCPASSSAAAGGIEIVAAEGLTDAERRELHSRIFADPSDCDDAGSVAGSVASRATGSASTSRSAPGGRTP